MSIFEMLAQEHEDQSFCGITVGIVSDIKDPEKKNRVKVRLLNRTDSLQETDYIRVMTPMAGKDYGAFFLPEVGDEVLVGISPPLMCWAACTMPRPLARARWRRAKTSCAPSNPKQAI